MLGSVCVVRGAPTVLLPASSEIFSCSQGQRRARIAGKVGSVFLIKRSSIKCLGEGATVYIPRLPVSSTAGLGHRSLSPIVAVPKGLNRTLRRCTCGGIIPVPLFDVSPLFKALKNQRCQA